MTPREQQQMMAQSLVELGNIESDQGNLELSTQYLEEALELFRELGHNEGQARVLNNLGLITAHKGEYQRALELYHQGLGLYQAAENSKGEAKILSNMAFAHKMNGSYSLARELAESAIGLHREHGSLRFEGIVLGNLGNICFELGELDLARQRYNASIKILSEIGAKRVLSIAILNLAGSSLLQGEPERALVELQRAHDIQLEVGDQRILSIIVGIRGRCYLDLNQLEQGKALLLEAHHACSELGIPEAGIWAGVLADLYSRSNHPDASVVLPLLRDGLRAVRSVPEELGRFQARAALVYMRLGDQESSVAALREAEGVFAQIEPGPCSELAMLISAAQRKMDDF